MKNKKTEKSINFKRDSSLISEIIYIYTQEKRLGQEP